MIPKIIHCVWFGTSSEYPEDVARCIETWKAKMPDYEIRIWNEQNFDLSACTYVKEAFGEKKYAFASDYVRLWALYYYGGIYLDTDVEVLKSFDDLLVNRAFAGFEDNDRIATCVLGSEKGNPLFLELLEEYHGRKFILGEGQYDLTPNPVPITRRLIAHSLCLNGARQELDEISIYPMDYFCPFNPYRKGADCFTDNTYANHHFNGTWKKVLSDAERKYAAKEKRFRKVFGAKWGSRICKHLTIIRHIGFSAWAKKYLHK